MPTVNYILGMNAKLYEGAVSGTETPTAITPFGVETMITPRPLATRGTLATSA